jgi:hypothetical protein
MAPEASQGVGLPGCPYIDDVRHWNRNTFINGNPRSTLNEAVKIHLNCERTPGNASSNPYKDLCPFHITFYEKLDGEISDLKNSQWKIGELFGNDPYNGNAIVYLRRSAFTVSLSHVFGKMTILIFDQVAILSMPSYIYRHSVIDKTVSQQSLDPFYTVLLLLPEGFELGQTHYFPYSPGILDQPTAFQAELSCIVQGLTQVIKQWAALDQHLGDLLVEDFMEPKQYSTLLFDDEKFSRSRKYFWAIGCLNEFIISIADNIKQWDMYHEARIKGLLDQANIAEALDAAHVMAPGTVGSEFSSPIPTGEEELQHIKSMVQTGVNHRGTLANLQTQFESKLETVKALRDGVCRPLSLPHIFQHWCGAKICHLTVIQCERARREQRINPSWRKCQTPHLR